MTRFRAQTPFWRTVREVPHRIHFDDENSVIVVRYWGDVGRTELDEVRVEIESSPHFRPGLDRVWDERSCRIDVSSDDLRYLADRWAERNELHGERRLAYLVSRDLTWGFNRQFESWRDAHGVHVAANLFRDFDELKEWLGLPADLPDPAVLAPGPDASS